MQNLDIENDDRLIVFAAGLGMSTSEVIVIVERFSKVAQEIVTALSKAFEPVIKLFRQVADYLEESDLGEVDREHKRELHKLNFTRPNIRHQVLERKPRNLIKKII